MTENAEVEPVPEDTPPALPRTRQPAGPHRGRQYGRACCRALLGGVAPTQVLERVPTTIT